MIKVDRTANAVTVEAGRFRASFYPRVRTAGLSWETWPDPRTLRLSWGRPDRHCWWAAVLDLSVVDRDAAAPPPPAAPAATTVCPACGEPYDEAATYDGLADPGRSDADLRVFYHGARRGLTMGMTAVVGADRVCFEELPEEEEEPGERGSSGTEITPTLRS